jgi:hypothetical protein
MTLFFSLAPGSALETGLNGLLLPPSIAHGALGRQAEPSLQR